VLTFALLSLLPTAEAAEQKYLFLGNSFIDYNTGLDGFFYKALEATVEPWPEVGTRRLTGPGYGLADHLTETLSTGTVWREELLDPGGDWNMVVFQDHGAHPGLGEGNPKYDDSIASGAALNDLVDVLPADTLLLLTWGRIDGDDRYPDRYPDYSAMQDRLTEGTLAYAQAWSSDDRPVFVVPAGLGYQRIHDGLVSAGADPLADDSDFARLFFEDGGHPSESGTYLAACILYASWTGRTPVGLEPPDIVPAQEIELVQQTAHDVVFDDPFGVVPLPYVFTWARWSSNRSDPGLVEHDAIHPLVGVDQDLALASLSIDGGASLWLRAGGSLEADTLILGVAGELGLDPLAAPPTVGAAVLAGSIRLLETPQQARTLLLSGPDVQLDGAGLVDADGFALATDSEGLWLISDDWRGDTGGPDTADSGSPTAADTGSEGPSGRCEGCSSTTGSLAPRSWALWALTFGLTWRRRTMARPDSSRHGAEGAWIGDCEG
jgi:hypothetical protein